MTDSFTFPNSPRGHELRAQLVTHAIKQGRTCREFEESWQDGKLVTTVLRLEVSKRLDEGKIAQDMKARKS
jgi:hypothetical protein